jgi:hypothetical protein
MRTLGLIAVALAWTTSLAAQNPGDDLSRAGALRQRIEERFTARVQEELGLSDQQAGKMRATASSWFDRRRGLEAEDQRIRQALAGQLRPGVAANKDSVSRLTDQLMDLKIRYAQTFRDEMKEMAGYLDPVQRAQYVVLRERLFDQIRRSRDVQDTGSVPLRRRMLRP